MAVAPSDSVRLQHPLGLTRGQVREGIFEVDDISVPGVDIDQAREMWQLGRVGNSLLDHDRANAVRTGVDRGGADAGAGSDAGDQEGVDASTDPSGDEGRPEEA